MNFFETDETGIEQINTEIATLASLYKDAQSIQEKCVDFQVPDARSHITFFADESECLLTFRPDGGKYAETRALSRHALGQLCNKVGVPAQYLLKCIQKGKSDLANDNVNRWIDEYDKNLFIRGYDSDMIRGILSDRYMVLDAPEILDVISSEVDPSEYALRGHYLTPERLHARIVHKDQMPVHKEDLFAGIQVDSSDVGRSTLVVSFFIYKQVCTNGLVVAREGGTLFKQRHLGNDKKAFRREFIDAMQQIEPLAEKYAKTITEMKQKSLKKDNEGIEAQLRSKQFNFSEDAAKKVLDTLNEKYERNQFGLVNAITEIAQEFTLERRLEIERAAGNMLLRVA